METEVQQLPDLTEAAPVESASEPEAAAEPAAPSSEPVEAESPEATPRTLETLLAEAEADESLKEALEAHYNELREEGRKKGRSDIQTRVEGAVRANREASQAAMQGVEEIKGLLVRGLRDGSITEQGLADAFGSNAQAMYVYDILRTAPVGLSAVTEFMGLLTADNPELAQRYAGRVADMVTGFDTKEAIVEDFLDDIVTAKVDAAKKPLQAKIRSLEAELERTKANGRDGQGPPQTQGASSGSKPYSQMTREERADLTPEQRDAAIAREIGA